MKNPDIIDCFTCRHFYVTWQQSNPRGCKAFGFKTSKMPSAVVLETSGEPCLRFSPKNPPKKKKQKKPDGWIA